MLTLIILNAFKGTKGEFCKAILTCLILDGVIILGGSI